MHNQYNSNYKHLLPFITEMWIYCPVCSNEDIRQLRKVQGYLYFQCLHCQLIFIDPEILKQMDDGYSPCHYDGTYWDNELSSSKSRSWGSSLARVAEVFLYSRRPIRQFLDIGSGPGYLLDALSEYLPRAANMFYGIELFPPPKNRTKHKNYIIGSINDLTIKFDAGACIEVIEHLTPNMLISLVEQLARKTHKNGIYIFNTGLVDYVLNEDIMYLDPTKRGHVIIWSIKSLKAVFERFGFAVIPIPGKTWAFLAEYMAEHDLSDKVTERIWRSLPENISVLKNSGKGELMYVLGLDTARAYV